MPLLRVFNYGLNLKRFNGIWEMQKKLFDQRKSNKIHDTLLVLQHHPVYTIGKRGKDEHFLKPAMQLQEMGYEIVKIDRGGEVTYHGPGQIVLYPILNLRALKIGARSFVNKIQSVMVDVSGRSGVEASAQMEGQTGVWIKGKKIGAVGIKISHGISTHGIAFNVSTGLEHYRNIIPCGLYDKEITDLNIETGRDCDIAKIQLEFIDSFSKEFGYDDVEIVSDVDSVTSEEQST